jgi:hypothetical protein
MGQISNQEIGREIAALHRKREGLEQRRPAP